MLFYLFNKCIIYDFDPFIQISQLFSAQEWNSVRLWSRCLRPGKNRVLRQLTLRLFIVDSKPNSPKEALSLPLFIMAEDNTRSAEMAVVTKRIFGDTGIHVRYTPCTSRCTALLELFSSKTKWFLRFSLPNRLVA